MLRKGQIKCKECGDPLPIDSRSTVIRCCSCGTIWRYDPSVHFSPQLHISGCRKDEFYSLTSNCFLGRNIQGYFSIVSEIDNTCKYSTSIRNPYVGKQHARIQVESVVEIVKFGDGERIIERKKCLISDCLSRNGTSVNGETLGPNQQRELKDGDRILLAPCSLDYLEIQFKNPLV